MTSSYWGTSIYKNPHIMWRTKWRILGGKIIYKREQKSIAMFDCRRVVFFTLPAKFQKNNSEVNCQLCTAEDLDLSAFSCRRGTS